MKNAGMAAQAILVILFVVSTASHAFFNRRMLLNYVRGHDAHPEIAREAVAAIILGALMLFFAVGHAFP